MNQAYNAANRYASNIARTRSFQNGLSALGRRAMAMNADDPRDVARTTAQSQATFARLRDRGYARSTYTGVRGAGGSGR